MSKLVDPRKLILPKGVEAPPKCPCDECPHYAMIPYISLEPTCGRSDMICKAYLDYQAALREYYQRHPELVLGDLS